MVGGWSMFPLRKSWGNQACTAWKRDGYLPVVFQLVQGSCWEDRAKLFTEVHGWRTRDNSLKLCQTRFQVDWRKKLFNMTKDWSQLPQGIVLFPALEVSQTKMDKSLSNLFCLLNLVWVWGWTRWLCKMSFVGCFHSLPLSKGLDNGICKGKNMRLYSMCAGLNMQN